MSKVVFINERRCNDCVYKIFAQGAVPKIIPVLKALEEDESCHMKSTAKAVILSINKNDKAE